MKIKKFFLPSLLVISIASVVYFYQLDKAAFPPVGNLHPGWAPQGGLLAYEVLGGYYSGNPDGFDLFVSDPEGKKVLSIATDYGRGYRWSPDGNKIAYKINRFSASRMREIRGQENISIPPDWISGYKIHEISTGEVFTLPGAEHLEWIPDSEEVVYFDMEGGLFRSRFDRSGKVKIHSGKSSPFPFYVSPDGNSVSFFRYMKDRQALVLIDLQEKKESSYHEARDKAMLSNAMQEWSRFNGDLLFVDRANNLFTMNLKDPEPVLIAEKVEEAHWSPVSGDLVYLIESNGLYRASVDGKKNQKIRPMMSGQIGWHPNGQYLIIGNYVEGIPTGEEGRFRKHDFKGTVLIDLHDSGGDLVINNGRTELSSPPMFSPDGEQILINAKDGFVIVDTPKNG